VTATENCGVEVRGRKMATCGFCSYRCKVPHQVHLRLTWAFLERDLLFNALEKCSD